MRLLVVTRAGSASDRVYGLTWRSRLNLLLVSKLHAWARPVSPVARYVEVGRELGHEVSLFSEPLSDLSGVWLEVAESTGLVVADGVVEQQPFQPR